MKKQKLSKAEAITVAAASAVTVGLIGSHMTDRSGSHSQPVKSAEAKPMPVETLKQRLGQLGVSFEKIKAYQNANGVELVTRVNQERELVGTDVRSGKQITDTTVHLSQFALQRLAQVPSGEGTGAKGELGPDGVQEFDISYAAPGNGGITDTVEVPVVPNQQVADELNGPLPE